MSKPEEKKGYTKKMISLDEECIEWLGKHRVGFNFSKWVRKRIKEEIKQGVKL